MNLLTPSKHFRIGVLIATAISVGSCSRPTPPAAEASVTSLPFAQALVQADSIEIPSLLVDHHAAAKELSVNSEPMHSYPVLGKTVLKNVKSRHDLIGVLLKDLEKQRQVHGGIPACFSPRHGIRAKFNGKTYDLVICFQCSQVKIYEDGQENPITFMVSEQPEAYFDNVLKEAKVSLSRDFEKPASTQGL